WPLRATLVRTASPEYTTGKASRKRWLVSPKAQDVSLRCPRRHLTSQLIGISCASAPGDMPRPPDWSTPSRGDSPVAPADDRRGRERPGSDPADHERPIRASQRARLRGLDGVRRDDVYGSAPQGSGPHPGADVPQGSGPLPGFGTPQGSGPLPETAPRPDSGTHPAGAPGSHDASGTVPSHAQVAASTPP